MERLSAPERTRKELCALMNGDLASPAGRGDLVRLALRLIVECQSASNFAPGLEWAPWAGQ
jgi:hypothetical protein